VRRLNDTKDNQQKQMLAAQMPKLGTDDHKSVAYFAAKEDFGRGEIGKQSNSKISKSCIKYGR